MPDFCGNNRRVASTLFLYGKPPRPAFCLMEKLSDSILMDMKIIFALQGMGKEARDA